MKKIKFILLTLTLICCEKNDSNIQESKDTEKANDFNINISPINDNIFIDKPTSFRITSNKLFNKYTIKHSEHNSTSQTFSLTKEYDFCHTIYDKNKTLEIIVENTDSIKKISNQNKYNFVTNQGEGVKIKSIKLVSFENQQLEFEDTEFNNNEKFKFIQFFISKYPEECNTFPQREFKINQWFFSKAISRSDEYIWDLSEKNIIINNKNLSFGLTFYYIDNDKNIIQNPNLDFNNLLETAHIDAFYQSNLENSVSIFLNRYKRSKPKTLNYEIKNLKLNILFELKW